MSIAVNHIHVVYMAVLVLAFSLVYVLSKDKEACVTSCPVVLENGRYVWADDKSIFPFFTETLHIGANLQFSVIQQSPLQYAMRNGSTTLFLVANNSVIVADYLPPSILAGRVYVLGKKPPQSRAPDFVTVDSELVLLTPGGGVFEMQYVTLKSDRSSGMRIKNQGDLTSMMTAITNRQPPQWIFGMPSAETVFANPLETFILPTGPLSPKAIPCVRSIYRPGVSTLTFFYSPYPTTCSYLKEGISYEKNILLSSTTAPSAMCVSLFSVLPSIIYPPSLNTTDGNVCFSSTACNLGFQSNITTIQGTLTPTSQPVLLKLGCSQDRINIVCR